MEDKPKFRVEVISKIINKHVDGKTKIQQDAVKLTAEFLGCFVEEAAHRAAVEAKAEELLEVTPEHLEKILPQLLLDF
eukprot:m.82987 g.82987  ORF g.82987 m.82987 type:complete len:78 (-) comp12898_c0_seq1:864-1097(-)